MVSPEARLLRYFVVVAQELSFTRAAERIGIAQPALSAAIRQLEAQLEVQLLARTTRSVELTDAGRALLDRAPAVLGGLQGAWEAARVAGRGELGTLRLVYGASTSYGTTPRLVEAVRERLPGLEVVTEMRATPQVVAAVRDGGADVGVARAPAAGDGVRVRTVRVERRGLLVRAGDPLAERAEVSLAEAAARPILMHPRATNPGHYDALLAALAAAGVPSPQLVERPVAFDPGGRLIREGRAIAIVGVSSAEGLAPDLRWVPLADPVPRIEVALLVREGPLSPAVDRFERIAMATAARLGWLADAASP
jgi:DNA-binding transcriptional LysR family regulator